MCVPDVVAARQIDVSPTLLDVSRVEPGLDTAQTLSCIRLLQARPQLTTCVFFFVISFFFFRIRIPRNLSSKVLPSFSHFFFESGSLPMHVGPRWSSFHDHQRTNGFSADRPSLIMTMFSFARCLTHAHAHAHAHAGCVWNSCLRTSTNEHPPPPLSLSLCLSLSVSLSLFPAESVCVAVQHWCRQSPPQ